MKAILIIFLFISNSTFTQNLNYFNKDREYHYNAIYIDKHGDTITQDKMILKPLGRGWLPQIRVQTAIRYLYYTDTIGYKNYTDPEVFFHEKDIKFFNKKGKVRISKKETVGASQKFDYFYIHPPRINQFRMLFYAAHPSVQYGVLNDSTNHFTKILGIYGKGDFTQNYTVTPLQDTLISSSNIKAWGIFVTSDGKLKGKFLEMEMYNSTLNAIFTDEYGFIKMHYTFENGIKIQFDFEKMVSL